MKTSLKRLKKYFRSERNNYYWYPRKYYYEGFLSRREHPDSFLKLYMAVKTYFSGRKVRLKNKIEFGASMKIVQKKLGRPNYKIRKTQYFDHHILFYKLLFGTKKAKCELHFWNGKFFYYNYSFPQLSRKDKSKVIDLLYQKYLEPDTNTNKVIDSSKIIDAEGNFITFNKDFELTIDYMSGDKGIMQELDRISAFLRNIDEKRKEDEINSFYKYL